MEISRTRIPTGLFQHLSRGVGGDAHVRFIVVPGKRKEVELRGLAVGEVVGRGLTGLF